MKKQIPFITIYLSVLILIHLQSACVFRPHSTKEIAFSKIVSVEDINQSIVLIDPHQTVTPSSPKPVFLVVVKNMLDEFVLFPFDFGVQLYQYQVEENRWIEVKNILGYSYSTNNVIAPHNDGIASEGTVFFEPDINRSEYPVEIRIVVLGNLYINEQIGDQVGAYIDVTLKP